MKKIVAHLLRTSVIIGVYFISAVSLHAQTGKSSGHTGATKENGSSDEAIPKQLMEQRSLPIKMENPLLEEGRSGNPPVINATCGDLGAENGWSSWTAKVGYHKRNFNGDNPVFFNSGAPTNPRFAITTGGGVDACTPNGGGPAVPVVAPGFGNSSIRIGQRETNGIQGNCSNNGAYPAPDIGAQGNGCSEELRFPFTVAIKDTNFIYAYAIFVENPVGGHDLLQAPYAEIYILDANGDTVPCSHKKYTADLNGGILPGFYTSSCPASSGNPGDIITYKPWTSVGVNLSKYIGQTLSVVITNTDCALGGHCCWSYWDFACPPISGNDPSFCLGNSTTLVGPLSDPTNPYTYTWHVNGQPYTGPPSATSVSITPTPQAGDIYAVHVHQSSGCDFWVPFKPQPMSVNPNFTSTGGCGGIVNFTDQSSTPDGSPIVSWNWNFGGGTPNTSTAQNPTGIAYPLGGTYSVTLIATSAGGCVDTIILPVTIIPAPLAAFSSNVVCFNNPTVFNDQSTGIPAPTQWAWNFGDGNTSTVQNPTHTYGSPGSFTVTLIATDPNGCKDTIKHPVFINPLPVANFSSTKVCFGNPTCFQDLSTISFGNITGYSWNFGDPNSGANNISTLASPCHIFTAINNFSVTLTVTSDSGCQSTVVLPVTFSPLPVALFSSTPVCLNTSTNFISSSTSSATDPINTWNWNFGDGTTSTQNNPTHVYTTAGSFTATLIVTTVQGCRDTVHNPVRIYAPPVANFSKPDSGCSPVYGNYTDLSTSADGTVNSWKWSFPGGSPSASTFQNPKNILYSIEGTYSVSLVVTTTFGCIDTIELPMIEVYGWPTADFCVTPTTAPSTNPVFSFCDMWSPNVATWSWNFGDSSPLDSTNTDPVHSYSATVNQNDFYTKQICLNVKTEHGCWASICRDVELIPEFVFYIPNTFTPNGDGTNDMFFGKCRGVKEYDIWIFDRWGNQLWDCHHEDRNINWDSDITNPRQEGLSSFCKWDGVVVQGGIDMGGNSGELAQEDVYVWKVKLLDIFNRRHTYIGHVNIVK